MLAQAVRLNVPVTVHVGVGYDILHEHPNCDGAALGQTSYQDFLTFAATVERLEGGVLLNFGNRLYKLNAAGKLDTRFGDNGSAPASVLDAPPPAPTNAPPNSGTPGASSNP